MGVSVMSNVNVNDKSGRKRCGRGGIWKSQKELMKCVLVML
jgi:hypothetical protein